MFRFFKRRAYRKAVEVEMSYLLGFRHDKFVAGVLIKYPAALPFVREKQREGEGTMTVASELLRIAITRAIESELSSEQREGLLAYLQTTSGEAPFAFASLCKMFLTQLSFQAAKLDANYYPYVVSEVVFAAQGMSQDRRIAERLARAVEGSIEALATPEPSSKSP